MEDQKDRRPALRSVISSSLKTEPRYLRASLSEVLGVPFCQTERCATNATIAASWISYLLEIFKSKSVALVVELYSAWRSYTRNAGPARRLIHMFWRSSLRFRTMSQRLLCLCVTKVVFELITPNLSN